MKRMATLHSMMEDARRRFFDAVRPLEPAADLAGAECGLHGLGEESLEKPTGTNSNSTARASKKALKPATRMRRDRSRPRIASG